MPKLNWLTKLIYTTAPKAAPEDTPVIDGSAKGFLNKLCIIAPASASDEPIKIANTKRGTLICQSILDIVASSPKKQKALSTSCHCKLADPKNIDTPESITSDKKSHALNTMALFLII